MSEILNNQNLYDYLEEIYSNQEDLFYFETLDLLENIFEDKESLNI